MVHHTCMDVSFQQTHHLALCSNRCAVSAAQVVIDKRNGGDQSTLADMAPGATVEVRTTCYKRMQTCKA